MALVAFILPKGTAKAARGEKVSAESPTNSNTNVPFKSRPLAQ